MGADHRAKLHDDQLARARAATRDLSRLPTGVAALRGTSESAARQLTGACALLAHLLAGRSTKVLASLPACLLTNLQACLLINVQTCLLINLQTCLPIDPQTRVPTGLQICEQTCLLLGWRSAQPIAKPLPQPSGKTICPASGVEVVDGDVEPVQGRLRGRDRELLDPRQRPDRRANPLQWLDPAVRQRQDRLDRLEREPDRHTEELSQTNPGQHRQLAPP